MEGGRKQLGAIPKSLVVMNEKQTWKECQRQPWSVCAMLALEVKKIGTNVVMKYKSDLGSDLI